MKDNEYSTEALIQKLKVHPFILNSNMPMGYVPSLPILCILNGNLCMKVPFLKYQITGQVDKTLVFPTKYVATITIPEQQIVAFENLAFQEAFSQVAFSNPIGVFRHNAVKDLNKMEYDKLRSSLYDEYDKIIDALVHNRTYYLSDEEHFKTLFNRLLEPSLKPFYKAIDHHFANKYITE